jgi:hypothetical protein
MPGFSWVTEKSQLARDHAMNLNTVSSFWYWEERPAVIVHDLAGIQTAYAILGPAEPWTHVDWLEVKDSGRQVTREVFEATFADWLIATEMAEEEAAWQARRPRPPK